MDESEESEESGERYRQGIYGSMKRFRTKFWRYFKIFLQAIRMVKKKNFTSPFSRRSLSRKETIRSIIESRITVRERISNHLDLELVFACVRVPHFQASFPPLTERSSCQQRVRGCTRRGCRGRVSSPRAEIRDARESRSTRWPRRDEARCAPRVEQWRLDGLQTEAEKVVEEVARGKSRRVTLAPASMAWRRRA